MARDFAELTQLFRNALADRLGVQRVPSPSAARLCFALGTPLPDDSFRTNDGSEYFPLRALEFMSHHSNVAPRLAGDTFLPTINQVDSLYGMMLSGASPISAADTALLGAVKGEAKSAFDTEIGSTIPPGFGTFRPTHAVPERWFDQDQSGNWSTITLEQAPPPDDEEDEDGGGGRGGGVHPGPINPTDLMFRPVDPGLFELLAKPVTVDSLKTLKTKARLGGLNEAAVENPFSDTHFVDRNMLENEVFANGVEVTSQNFRLDAEVCLVDLRRPWLSGAFLQLRNWFVQSFDSGELASGDNPEDGSPLAAIAVGCVLIRNLQIRAEWNSADEAQSLASTHLGLFSLAGRRFDTTTATLSVSGMQSVGWICQPMPTLPPQPTPA